MLQDDLKEIVRLARMAPPSDYTIKIARIAESALEEIAPEPEIKLESIQVVTPEPEPPLDLESIRIKLQTGEKVELPARPVEFQPPDLRAVTVHDLLEKTDQEREEELLGDGVIYDDPSIPLEISMSDDDVDGIASDGEIVFDPTKIDPTKLDPRDV